MSKSNSNTPWISTYSKAESTNHSGLLLTIFIDWVILGVMRARNSSRQYVWIKDQWAIQCVHFPLFLEENYNLEAKKRNRKWTKVIRMVSLEFVRLALDEGINILSWTNILQNHAKVCSPETTWFEPVVWSVNFSIIDGASMNQQIQLKQTLLFENYKDYERYPVS